jgi:hypothetical protein
MQIHHVRIYMRTGKPRKLDRTNEV